MGYYSNIKWHCDVIFATLLDTAVLSGLLPVLINVIFLSRLNMALHVASRLSKSVANLSAKACRSAVTVSSLKYSQDHQQNKQKFRSEKGYAKAGILGSAAAASMGLYLAYGKKEVQAEAAKPDWIKPPVRSH